MRYLLILAAAFLVAFGIPWLQANADEPPAQTVTVTKTVARTYQRRTAKWWAYRAVRNRRQLNTIRHTLKAGLATNSGLERAFLCIHGFEGSWTDTGAPYWGGLQMDQSFMRTYGAWAVRAFGTADRWPVSVQIATAIRAKVSGRGFYPWPNTARACGLL